MADKTKIQWTDATWNPVRGCSRVSEGCRNCYAERDAMRMAGPGGAYEGLVQIVNGHSRWTGTVALAGSSLTRPLDWNRPRRIFVNSMSDLFHENLPDEAIDKVFAVMALCPQHQFQILTKRPERQLGYFDAACGRIADRVMEMRRARGNMGCVGPLPHLSPGSTWWPLPNVWLGVSVEDQKTADERIPLLMGTPAKVRWISAEPLLGPVDLTRIELLKPAGHRPGAWLNALTGHVVGPDDITEMRLNWVVVGGESGPAARPMHPDWARSLRDQCQAAGVRFLFKQWGEWAPDCLCATKNAHPEVRRPEPGKPGCMFRCGKRRAGRELDGRAWDEFPEVVECGR